MIKDKIRKLIGILSIPFMAAACNYPRHCTDETRAEVSDLGVSVCTYGNKVTPAEIDQQFSDVEQKLGYQNTSTDLEVHIFPAETCKRKDGTFGYCLKRGDAQFSGLFFYPDIVATHNGNDTIPLEKTTLRFELNRYIKYQNDDPTWNCAEYERARKGEKSCLDTYVK